ncbi:hypothetical protein K437DRAFT_148496 [Tilletiaria anomala UBC 951]|uniref:Uncharacterized protein n=1 Tax=Tilletiaria anomala (strain ATCC 24038 / CBS 436.72 / UBC 951) TaxID=1037660 RepID=A0A066WG91_TILAU|nr:uncharacterized protein K437DRAFT_148496 [Tilletiaria anomala UBC 951]KDN52796.1 hypothetical protein K437DRAFT_148496 [Tilletiaria anomala UBC 951]
MASGASCWHMDADGIFLILCSVHLPTFPIPTGVHCHSPHLWVKHTLPLRSVAPVHLMLPCNHRYRCRHRQRAPSVALHRSLRVCTGAVKGVISEVRQTLVESPVVVVNVPAQRNPDHDAFVRVLSDPHAVAYSYQCSLAEYIIRCTLRRLTRYCHTTRQPHLSHCFHLACHSHQDQSFFRVTRLPLMNICSYHRNFWLLAGLRREAQAP